MARVDLNDYVYVNARVRGMRSHLLTRDFFMRLVEADNFEALHALLEQTIYRREVNEAFLLNPVRPDYDQALTLNLIAAFRKILDAVGGDPRRLVNILLSRYDVQNIKSVLRGKHGDATTSEITNILVPVGSLRLEQLEVLAGQREIRDVINTMQSQQMKYARPLIDAYPDFTKKDHDLAVLELALDKYFYRDAIEQLKGKGTNTEMVRQMLVGEVDMRNISTLVRIRGVRLDDEEVENLRIPGGALSADEFLHLDRLGDIVRIVSDYPDPRYRKVLQKALAEYQEIDLVAFDRELEHEMTRRGAAMSNLDVLSIGVIIGFMWQKNNEVINLRILLRGKAMDRPQAQIRSDLFFVERAEGQA
ncbi:MAG: V-type ATPase subunit [Actinomycetota bacterium]